MTESRPIVSVIIPVFNGAATLGDSIESVRRQVFTNWELLIINDCSTDNSMEVAKNKAEIDGRIRIIELESHFGAPARPRNVGIDEAKGAYIAFLDADDLWHERKLEIQLKCIGQTGTPFCSSALHNFKPTDYPKLDCDVGESYSKVTFGQQLRRYRTPLSSVVVEKGLMKRFPFNENMKYKAREDMDCWLRIHDHIGESVKLRDYLVYYRVSPNQISGRKMDMVGRTLFVLSRFTFKDGRTLGNRKYLYLTTHIAYSIYWRAIRGIV